MASKVLKTAARPPNAGKGRKKGVPNKVTAAVKDMILQALANKGGVKYLEQQADENPVAFMGLVGKVLPLDVNANLGGSVTITKIELVAPTSLNDDPAP